MAFDSYTKALLHFNGTDGLTTFTDEIGKTWTAHGGAQLDTAQAKFGESSAYFIPAGYVDTPDHADWALGSSDFTFDMWVNVGIGSFQTIFKRSISYWFSIGADGVITLKYHDTGTGSDEYVSGGTVSNNTWTHIAVVMSSLSLVLYVDGVGSSPAATGGIYNTAGSFSIGEASYVPGGWIDEFRFSKGVARWNSNFNPPTAPYSSSSFLPQVMMIGE